MTMEMINTIISSYKHIPYTMKHLIMVNKISWKYFSTLYVFHDVDKILLYIFLPILGTKSINKIHRKLSQHHVSTWKIYTDRNLVEMVCDWESARFTKPDKPLTARETCEKYYPELKNVLGVYFNIIEKKSALR